MSFRRVNSQIIVQGEDHGRPVGHRARTRHRRHHPAAGGPLSGRRQRAQRDPAPSSPPIGPTSIWISTAPRPSTWPAATCLDAVQTSVNPKVIDCPDPKRSGKTTLSAIAKNGVELKVRAGSRCGPTSSSSSAGPRKRRSSPAWARASSPRSARPNSHLEVMERPDRISKAVLGTRPGRADGLRDRLHRHCRHRRGSEHRRPACRPIRPRPTPAWPGPRPRSGARWRMAREQEMKAQVARNRANVVLAEAEVPMAMAAAFREGNLNAVKAKV